MPESLPLGNPAFDPQLAEHAVSSFATAAGITLHVTKRAGRNVHHIIEATFKGLARCLRDAVRVEAPPAASRRPKACCDLGGSERVRSSRVVDYGIGNLHSAQKALERQGADARLTADPGLIADAVGVVLPGVGAFGACMDALRAAGWRSRCSTPWRRAGRSSGSASARRCCSTPARRTRRRRGLGVIPGTVRWIPPGVKRPQMQWNQLDVRDPDDPMFAGLGERPWFYFVHSLHGVPDDPATVAATCDYGGTVNAAFRPGNVFAAQFHPEKSAAAGLGLLGNFVDVARACRT